MHGGRSTWYVVSWPSKFDASLTSHFLLLPFSFFSPAAPSFSFSPSSFTLHFSHPILNAYITTISVLSIIRLHYHCIHRIHRATTRKHRFVRLKEGENRTKPSGGGSALGQ